MRQYRKSFAAVKQKFLSTSQNVAAAPVRGFIHFFNLEGTAGRLAVLTNTIAAVA
jgi:hypothetical protein